MDFSTKEIQLYNWSQRVIQFKHRIGKPITQSRPTFPLKNIKFTHRSEKIDREKL